MRKIHEVTGPKGTAKIYRDAEWQEYRVKFFTPEGEHLKEADHHTDDKGDAKQTAETWANS